MNLVRGSFTRLPPSVQRRALHVAGRYAPWEAGFDFTPPTPAPGERTGPPDFVGIGVQKAGTTWWYDLLARHPGVSARSDLHKERHYFDRFGAAAFGPEAAADYAGWFPRPVGRITGEWTPDYFAYPWVPTLLRRAAPEARLLLLLRDPVERMASGLRHEARAGGAMGGGVLADATGRGFYHRALAWWLEHFDRSRILVLQYERCVLEPAGQLARTLRFLGLPDGGAADLAGGPGRVPGPAPLDPELRRRLVGLYEGEVAALAAVLDDLDLSLWPNFGHLGAGGA